MHSTTLSFISVCSDTKELKDVQDIESGSKLLMFPKQYCQLYDGSIDNEYGACTYPQIVEQTPAGVAKFYSCLYYMVREYCSCYCPCNSCSIYDVVLTL